MFLVEAKNRGWDVHGTEYTDEAIAVCKRKGITMKQGKLSKDWFPEGHFDIVTSFEVIEHINNPREETANINHILREGGLFYFTTPNFNAIERYVLKEKYNVIEYPEHLCYYTKKTINYLLKNAGFRKLRLLTTGFSISRLKVSMGNAASNERSINNSTDERIRASFETNRLKKFVKKTINSALNIFGVGSSLKGWYLKSSKS